MFYHKVWLYKFVVLGLVLITGAGICQARDTAGDWFDSAFLESNLRDTLSVYVHNPGKEKVEFIRVWVDGKDVIELAKAGQDVPFNEPKEGVVRWFDIVPNPIAPGVWGVVRVRFGAVGAIKDKVQIKLQSAKGEVIEKTLPVVSEPSAKFCSYSFSEDFKKLYLWVKTRTHTNIKSLMIDGRDYPIDVKNLRLEPQSAFFITANLREGFQSGEYKIVKIDTDNGSSSCLIRVMAPFFPVGLWVVGYSEEALEGCKDYLFNFTDTASEYPDIYQRYGVRLYPHPVNQSPEEEWGKPELTWVKERAKTPSFYTWLLYDEPEICGKPWESPMFMLGWMKYFREDGGHIPVWVNHVPEAACYADYNFTDIMSMDVYPVPGDKFPHKPNKPREDRGILSRVEEEMDASLDAVGHVPVWFVAQTYMGDPEIEPHWCRYPTPDEERLMVYMALAHGAKGIIYFGLAPYSDMDGASGILWRSLKPLNVELHMLAPLLLKGTPLPIAKCNKPKVEAQAVACGNEAICVFLINHDYDSITPEPYSTFRPAKDVKVEVALSGDFVPVNVLELSSQGLKELKFQRKKDSLIFSIDELEVAKAVLITLDKRVSTKLEESRKGLLIK